MLVLALRRWEPPLVLRLRRHASRRCARQAADGDTAHLAQISVRGDSLIARQPAMAKFRGRDVLV